MRNFLNDHGPLNGLLQTLHITNGPIPFLTDPLWAKLSIIFVNMWIGIPFHNVGRNWYHHELAN